MDVSLSLSTRNNAYVQCTLAYHLAVDTLKLEGSLDKECVLLQTERERGGKKKDRERERERKKGRELKFNNLVIQTHYSY